MAGKFRGDVGKLSSSKLSKSAKRAKGKKVVAMVKRSPKMAEGTLHNRIALLTSKAASSDAKPSSSVASKTKIISSSTTQQAKKLVGRAAIEIIGSKKEKVVPEKDVVVERSPAEAQGLKILHHAVLNQSYKKLLPHQNRHDYEYRLRSVATMGVVQLFNSLAQARKASTAVEREDTRLTADKALEKQHAVSKEAFLEALRQPQRMQEY